MFGKQVYSNQDKNNSSQLNIIEQIPNDVLAVIFAYNIMELDQLNLVNKYFQNITKKTWKTYGQNLSLSEQFCHAFIIGAKKYLAFHFTFFSSHSVTGDYRACSVIKIASALKQTDNRYAMLLFAKLLLSAPTTLIKQFILPNLYKINLSLQKHTIFPTDTQISLLNNIIDIEMELFMSAEVVQQNEEIMKSIRTNHDLVCRVLSKYDLQNLQHRDHLLDLMKDLSIYDLTNKNSAGMQKIINDEVKLMQEMEKKVKETNRNHYAIGLGLL